MPIQDQAVPHGSGSGITIGMSHPEGEVAEFECREAARFACLTWPEFAALSWREKANTVAHYRLQSLIESHRNAAAMTR